MKNTMMNNKLTVEEIIERATTMMTSIAYDIPEEDKEEFYKSSYEQIRSAYEEGGVIEAIVLDGKLTMRVDTTGMFEDFSPIAYFRESDSKDVLFEACIKDEIVKANSLGELFGIVEQSNGSDISQIHIINGICEVSILNK